MRPTRSRFTGVGRGMIVGSPIRLRASALERPLGQFMNAVRAPAKIGRRLCQIYTKSIS